MRLWIAAAIVSSLVGSHPSAFAAASGGGEDTKPQQDAHGTPPSSAGGREPSPVEAVPWSEVSRAIGETICMFVRNDSDWDVTLVPMAGNRATCGAPQAKTPLARAVDKAFVQTRKILVAMNPEGMEEAFKGGVPLDERSRIVREAYLRSARFQSVYLPRLIKAMAEEGLDCGGCPEIKAPPVRKVTWSALAPYVGAFAWPDPVTIPRDSNGVPVGKPTYTFQVRMDRNGIGEMENPDRTLVEAAHLGVKRTPDLKTLVEPLFQRIVSEPSLQQIDGDYARTSYLRKRLPEEIAKDEGIKAAICRALETIGEDLPLRLTDCPPETRLSSD